MKDPKREGARWLEQAERDFEAAGTICEDGYWWITCFQAQQAAEKAAKAYLYSIGERLVFGHSVVELVKKAAEEDASFAGLMTEAAQLDRFYIPTRYPNGLPGGIPAESYSEQDARSALKIAGAILDCVKKAIARV